MKADRTADGGEAAALLPWRQSEGGLLLFARLTPRSANDALDGTETLSDGRCVLKLRVRALPSEGEANAALVALLARLLCLPKSAVTLKAGKAARIKTLHAAGNAGDIEARLSALLADVSGKKGGVR
jgi:uncharacterized protein YggU (UPF0235/DUF167 family)